MSCCSSGGQQVEVWGRTPEAGIKQLRGAAGTTRDCPRLRRGKSPGCRRGSHKAFQKVGQEANDEDKGPLKANAKGDFQQVSGGNRTPLVMFSSVQANEENQGLKVFYSLWLFLHVSTHEQIQAESSIRCGWRVKLKLRLPLTPAGTQMLRHQ